MLYTGTSGFALQKQLSDQINGPRFQKMEFTTQLAKTRFDIGVEKAKQNELVKQLEEKEIAEAKKRRQEAEDLRRKTDLSKAQNANL